MEAVIHLPPLPTLSRKTSHASLMQRQLLAQQESKHPQQKSAVALFSGMRGSETSFKGSSKNRCASNAARAHRYKITKLLQCLRDQVRTRSAPGSRLTWLDCWCLMQRHTIDVVHIALDALVTYVAIYTHVLCGFCTNQNHVSAKPRCDRRSETI